MRITNFCWCCFKWGLIVGLIGIIAGVLYFHDRVDDEIRSRVLQRIAECYPDLQVTLRFAELVEGEGIRVRDLSIAEPGTEDPRAVLIHFDEIFFHCPTDYQDLIGGEPQITHVTIRSPTVRAVRLADGTFDVAKLLTPQKHASRSSSPSVTIENGTIEILDPQKTPASKLPLRGVNLTLTPQEASGKPAQAAGVWKIKGTLSADHVRRVNVEGWIDTQRRAWSIAGSVEGLDISPEFRDALPQPQADALAVLGELRGHAALGFRVDYDPSAETPCDFDVSVRLKGGRVDDPRLPDPLTDVQATMRVNNRGFVINELAARIGQAELRISLEQSGFEPGRSPMTLEATIRELELDRHFLDVLPRSLQEKMQQQWSKYDPAGKVDADVALVYDGKTWRPDVSLRCLDVSFAHYKFPYRLEHATGTVTWKDDLLRVAEMTAYAGSQPVHIRAEVRNPMTHPSSWLEAWGSGLEIDKEMLLAVHERSRAFLEALHPRGTFDFRLTMTRDGPDQPQHKDLVMELNHCAIRYDAFPYPVDKIRGTLVMHDDDWTFHELEGFNGSGRITCVGYMKSPRAGRELLLKFAATDVLLENELRDALWPNMRRVWNDLKLRGLVDLDEVVVHRLPGQKKADISVTARPQSDTASIEPACFPFRMGKLRGVLHYRNGRTTLQGFRAEHGPVTIAADARCDFRPDGSWDLRLQRLTVDRLRLEDRELIRALPGRLRKAIVALRATGPVHVRGTVDLHRGPAVDDPVCCEWDLEIGMHQGSLDVGVRIENVHGSMTLVGAFDGRSFYSRGELAVDSVSYRDFQFTQLMGPIWIDDRQVLFGSWVGRRDNAVATGDTRHKPRQLTAGLFGGTVYGDAWISLEPNPRYGLRAALARADLNRFAREVITGRQALRGRLGATVELSGTGRSLNGMRGRGRIWLRDADIYELPVMISLLKILSIREPNRNAFDRSDIDFHIQGEHVYLDRINFNGNAISLLGHGEMNFQSKIDLTFHTIVGNDQGYVPVLRELVGLASQQALEIRVQGTLQEPDTQKKVLPWVGEALQRLRNDLQKGGNSPGLFSPPRTRVTNDPRQRPNKW